MTKVARVVTVSGTFAATGQSAAFRPLPGTFSMWLQGGVGTVKLERSTDLGTTWIDVNSDAIGTVASWALNTTEVSQLVDEPEIGAQYRFNCTAYTSGTITYRLGQ